MIERAKMKAEVDAYNAENQRMQMVNAMDKNLPPKDLLYVKLKKVPCSPQCLAEEGYGSVTMETAHMKFVYLDHEINLVHLQRDKMSSDDLLAKFDEIVKRFRCAFHEIIERAKMKAEVDGYNAEKQRM
ncbi:Hypothetical predicted protein [Paramuricea clavata]|uniref:Uncharacterized protein n=1 Tax=Paramuricea clavata TaxID=317549 RepID=A0A7D9HY64_PARCT|nr:Hypothetical predicted protein [Paramuricea clavata]